ncbi:holo-ACP synthase [Fusibacter paucivorans]|uniref:Holo-[acyl-carrier-protein] synthase n=1 Tax=Fusibacter paucivorans TaxID=76009 RepID=A0ABS5PRG8_9FIRM|nr:holo-ACP synthase [Fusibacter paucivorans]MBS7527014.1 holo-ACP synthase [Fusibacter paucivorans]
MGLIGNGVDLLEIERIVAILKKRPHFIERYFTENERVYFELKHMKAETIAATFAAKEAVSKCFGTGVRGFELKEIEVLRDELGKPYIILHGKAKTLAESLKITELQLSLSHSKKMVVAFVIAIGGH